ncbi:arrestin domain-containing protein 4 [Anolis carolinensis]|uniref:Arrestin C-terminal-like domain-containing protein n=1 Tax=Anolis carolinensis TaxID=28377 RepID=H9G377_ANOCA|nr:PREDICTED: arrestin domain-containing protein 4 [Anolis carolinensis]|eukprot:XP_003226319.1 PREDICTED: arrestin domain-containing protein 4 [Anolis carolinensis]
MAVAVAGLQVGLSPAEDGGAYCGGEAVSGWVALQLAAPAPLRALRLRAAGEASAAWREGPHAPGPGGEPPPSPGTRMQARAVCLDLRQTLLGREEEAGSEEGDEGLILLEAGKHEFPFSFQLPQQPLATSFTGKYGSIQYFVEAILERPMAPTQSVKREFQVISHIDVNSPLLLTPARQCQEKMVGCWFFTSGPVSLSAKIERKGYCNGEAIPIYAEIENCSSRLIVPKAAIFQTQTYLASGKTKTFRQMVANVRGNHVASGSTDTWNGKTLKIPPVTPSILDCCIIRVDYSLAVYIHIPGAKKLMLELPLVIGTIPCTAFSSRNSSLVSQFSVDMSWLALTMPEHPEAPPNYADIVSEEEFSRHVTAYPAPVDHDEQLCCPMFAYIQEFRFQPPPLYSEIDPHPTEVEVNQPVSIMA